VKDIVENLISLTDTPEGEQTTVCRSKPKASSPVFSPRRLGKRHPVAIAWVEFSEIAVHGRIADATF